IPTLGICLGMQMMVIEFARNVLGLENANSREMDPSTPYNVIDLMEEQKSITQMGGTMRLGAYSCELSSGSKAYEAYGKSHIEERHRHRYEFSSPYRQQFERAGMLCTGINPDSGLVEIVEVPSCRWYVGVQFHPEYTGTVLNPNPLFMAFVKSTISKDQ
ncbi:MAG: gamma-glutamyl-gamma-aminobutyrate hydrolase family protein, partial [Bacteroidaceae bacterium]|nr:gamma-glutamyl-gamma-aminobutyrate hydrolase family protein [Bacteroidaceae bacterium]